MKKKLILIAAVLFALTGCNKQLADTTFYFDKAMIQLPKGCIEWLKKVLARAES